jgi:putative transposase
MAMQQHTEISERRACRLVGVSRSVLHYCPDEAADTVALRARLVELAAQRRRFGYRRLHARVRREGIEANHK